MESWHLIDDLEQQLKKRSYGISPVFQGGIIAHGLLHWIQIHKGGHSISATEGDVVFAILHEKTGM